MPLPQLYVAAGRDLPGSLPGRLVTGAKQINPFLNASVQTYDVGVILLHLFIAQQRPSGNRKTPMPSVRRTTGKTGATAPPSGGVRAVRYRHCSLNLSCNTPWWLLSHSIAWSPSKGATAADPQVVRTIGPLRHRLVTAKTEVRCPRIAERPMAAPRPLDRAPGSRGEEQDRRDRIAATGTAGLRPSGGRPRS